MLEITDSGLVIDRLDAILDRVSTSFTSIYGTDINIAADTPDGQMIGIFSQGLADINEVIQMVYAMLDPDKAVGAWLDQRVGYAGIKRKQGQYSYCYGVQFNGSAVVPKGFIVTDKNGTTWQTDAEFTAPARGTLRSTELGAFTVQEGDVFTPKTIILGLDDIKATQASKLGSNQESDGALRIRFMQSHSVNNMDDRQGMEAAIKSVDDVAQVNVIENDTATTDSNGVPSRSINAIVLGGADADIAKMILKKKAGGYGLFGSTSITIQYQGKSRAVRFDRPTRKSMTVVVKVKRSKFGTDIDANAIKEKLSAHEFKIGQTVYAIELGGIITSPDYSVVSVTINGAAEYAITARQYAAIDASNVTVDII